MPSSNKMKCNMEEQIDLQDLYEELLQDKVVVCLGPELYTAPGGATLEESMAHYLREREEHLGIRVYDNGWYHHKENASPRRVHKAIRDFYSGITPHSTELLQKLVDLPFHLYLSMTPDWKLKEFFKVGDQIIPVQEAYYDLDVTHENNPYGEFPTKEFPLMYNLLGSTGKESTLVYTYDAFYDFLNSTFENMGMDPELKKSILEAEFYFFLGVPFDNWYVHLFMRVLEQHGNPRRRSRKAEKYASNHFLENEGHLYEHCKDQYKLEFLSRENGMVTFIDGFYNFCREAGALRSQKYYSLNGMLNVAGKQPSWEVGYEDIFDHLRAFTRTMADVNDDVSRGLNELETTWQTVKIKLSESGLSDQLKKEFKDLFDSLKLFIAKILKP